jgi:hypothetical protein
MRLQLLTKTTKLPSEEIINYAYSSRVQFKKPEDEKKNDLRYFTCLSNIVNTNLKKEKELRL